MEPTRNSHATLVDLLDRVLDKGLVVYADIIISVAGIPLIGVNLRAALAGMETMLKYGVMQEWDERIRAWERDNRRERVLPLGSGDETDTCPRCGQEAKVGELLQRGCDMCGWVSPRSKEEVLRMATAR